MYRSFTVDGFRSHSHASFDDFGQVNILTGLNDAGKTSILEALFLHASGPLAALFTIQTLRPGRKQDDMAVTPSGIDEPWNAIFHNFEVDQQIKLAAKTSDGQQVVVMEQSVQGDGQVAVGARPITDNQHSRTSMQLQVTSSDNAAPQTYKQSMIVLNGSNAGGQTISIEFRLEPTGEALQKAAIVKPGAIGTDLAAGYSEMRRNRAGAELLEALRAIDDRISQLEVLAINGRSQLHAEVNGQLIPFELLGDGPNAVAQALISMWGARNGILLIDEVGSGVHFSVLETMWRSLYRAAKKLNVQIFATTHSNETIRAAHEVIRDRQDSLAVYRLRRPADSRDASETRVTRYSGQALAAAIEVNAELR